MVTEYTNGPMDEFIEVNGSMIKNMVKEFKSGKMEKNMMASGFTINNTGKVSLR